MNHIQTRASSALASLVLAFSIATLAAEEKDGLRVDVVPKIVDNEGPGPRSFAAEITPVKKTMTLKATVKNVSMKDIAEASIDYAILVNRWTGTEQQLLNQYTGTVKLPALRPAEQVELDVGQYHIGGHRHGTSSRHEDKLAGWKIVVTQAGRSVEFRTPTTFEELSRRAKPGRRRTER